MGEKTGISWTTSTWNPIRGCSRVSPGCQNCYAEVMANRYSGVDKNGKKLAYHGLVNENGMWNGNVVRVQRHMHDPLRWKDPRKIFVNSMSDLFHENLPFSVIDEIFGVMALAQHHTFQVLTKRSKRMKEYFSLNPTGTMADVTHARVARAAKAIAESRGEKTSSPYWDAFLEEWPLQNVWLGVSTEDQPRANERIPDLLETPAAVRWISAEPLLGPLDLKKIQQGPIFHPFSALRRWSKGGGDTTGLDWVVVGGESTQRMQARPCMTDWVRDLKDQCVTACVPIWVKQLGQCCVYGGYTSGRNDADGLMEHWPRSVLEQGGQFEYKMPDGRYVWRVYLKDSHGGDMDEWPEDLRRQEFPGYGRSMVSKEASS